MATAILSRCVVSERPIDRSEIVLTAHVVGGLQTIDNGKVDDKIIAILQNDNFWGDIIDISALPKRLIERLQHYFSTYKMIPGKETSVFVKKVYGRQHAYKVIKAAIEDYDEKYAYVMKKKK
jgi:inorganic pyrophosphatase